MVLDFQKVASDVIRYEQELLDNSNKRSQAIVNALEQFSSPIPIEDLKTKITDGKTSFLVAELIDGINNRHGCRSVPSDYMVVATDGSQIDVDRHRSTRNYLINIGSVVIRYGRKADAHLSSDPTLYINADDMYIRPPDSAPGREIMVEGSLLGIKRTVQEVKVLSDLCSELPSAIHALAMVDGSLIMWQLTTREYPDYVIDEMLDRGVLKAFEQIRQSGLNKQLALVSYISRPRSTDVVNALRISICPYSIPDCDRYCQSAGSDSRPCDILAGVQDRDIFTSWLQPGQRSDIFISQSRILKSRYGRHLIYFYYLNIGHEIARVELPEWVACDRCLLELSHSLIMDQCHKGYGYPVALSEAHEQAVVTNNDRENLYQLIDELMIKNGITPSTSLKSRSKHTRWI